MHARRLSVTSRAITTRACRIHSIGAGVSQGLLYLRYDERAQVLVVSELFEKLELVGCMQLPVEKVFVYRQKRCDRVAEKAAEDFEFGLAQLGLSHRVLVNVPFCVEATTCIDLLC